MATQLIRPAGRPVLDPGLCPHTSTGTHTEREVKLGGEGGGNTPSQNETPLEQSFDLVN